MKAIILDRYGSSLRLGEMPEPELRDDDVLVQVHAAGVNPLDAKIKSGEFKLVLPYRLPLISISGPPDPAFAEEIGASWFVKSITRLLSLGIRRKAKRGKVSFSFLFMKANGGQLREIAALIDSGVIRPVVDQVFPFESSQEAMAYVETGRAKGKVVVKMR